MTTAKAITGELTAMAGKVLYQIPPTFSMTGNIRLANRNTFSVRVRVAICKASTPDPSEYIEYDASIPPGGIMEDTALIMVSGEYIYAWADNDNVSVRIHGIEEVL